MADVDAVSAVELFGAHLTGAATREFAQILFDCAAKLYVDIDVSEVRIKSCAIQNALKNPNFGWGCLSHPSKRSCPLEDVKLENNKICGGSVVIDRHTGDLPAGTLHCYTT